MCNPNSRKLCGDRDCEICFLRSFAGHKKAKYWSDKDKFTPLQIRKIFA